MEIIASLGRGVLECWNAGAMWMHQSIRFSILQYSNTPLSFYSKAAILKSLRGLFFHNLTNLN
jgi:hypothetical protein